MAGQLVGKAREIRKPHIRFPRIAKVKKSQLPQVPQPTGNKPKSNIKFAIPKVHKFTNK